MYKGEQSIIIDSSIQTAYEVAETYPYFVSFFKKTSKALFQNEKQLKVEVHSNLFKIFPISWQGEGIKERYKAIHFRQTKGLFKGLIADWIFEEINGKTKVTIATDFTKPEIGKFGEKIAGHFIVEKTTRKILNELKDKSEKRK